ncbi:hypothetical protein [Actinospica robiniae]|uniref:hypothetical protein n=1 Tax=Actinospica robiniae TaxID=304901 RepID=UPI00040D3318|nr:hypothetical protein [Actinospica robiniae]
MGRAFDSEFADELWRFGGTPYQPLARITSGSGDTFLGLARDGRPTVVKLHRPAGAADVALIRMQSAAELISALGSPRIARHLAVGEVRGLAWTAAEYVPGPSLQEAVDGYGPLSQEGVRHLARGLVEAFSALRDAGLTGRGVTARDVVLGRIGPIVVDVGLTRIEGADGRIESADEAESTAEDVRAIGALLYLAATGRPASSASGDILSPAVGNCPNALREAIESSQRVRPAARPSLEQLARAADETWVPASLATKWLAEPWQSADVLREIDDRANELARLRSRAIERAILAAAAPPSLSARRSPAVRWEKNEPAVRNRRWLAGAAVRALWSRRGR